MDLFKYLVIVLLIASTVLAKGMNVESDNSDLPVKKEMICIDVEKPEPLQTGIIEFFPLTSGSGFKVRVSEEGEHNLSIKDEQGNIIAKSFSSGDWLVVDGMTKGSYVVVVTLEGGESYTFKLII